MIKKRFRVIKVDDMYGVSDDKSEYTVAWDDSKIIMDNLCELLNNLHEDNEQYKRFLIVMNREINKSSLLHETYKKMWNTIFKEQVGDLE